MTLTNPAPALTSPTPSFPNPDTSDRQYGRREDQPESYPAVEDLADGQGDDERPGALRVRLDECMSRRADLQKGYMVLEDDMTMSLEEFARKFGREDGEAEYALRHHAR